MNDKTIICISDVNDVVCSVKVWGHSGYYRSIQRERERERESYRNCHYHLQNYLKIVLNFKRNYHRAVVKMSSSFFKMSFGINFSCNINGTPFSQDLKAKSLFTSVTFHLKLPARGSMADIAIVFWSDFNDSATFIITPHQRSCNFLYLKANQLYQHEK